MKKIIKLILCAFLSINLSACSKQKEIADTIVYGNIYLSENNYVEAMAIKDGKIICLGTTEEVDEYLSYNTAIADYSDNFIMAGFIDGHVHAYVDAENSAGFILSDCESQTEEEYLKVIKEYIEANPDKEIYEGFGWLDSAFIGGSPTAAALDEICSDKPIFIKSEDCHSCWCNTKMMEMAGITSSTSDPIGGKIEKDSNGNPSGCFRDTAMDELIKPYVPVYSVDEYVELLKTEQDKLLKYGYTAYNDVIIDPSSAANICEAYYNLDKAGLLKVDVNVSILINNSENYIEDLNKVIELKEKYDTENFKITDIKIFMDGIVESETAYVSVPYENSDSVGADRWPNTNRLYDLVKRINDAGLVAHFHAIGDAAITKALDAIEYARKNSTNNSVRNCITHFQMISDNDIKRMKQLNVIAVANLGWAPSTNSELGNENIEEINVGKQRNEAMYPFKTIIDEGIITSYATDYPAGPVDYSIYNIEAGVTRQILNYSSTLRNGAECISIYEALKCMSENGAYQLGRENEIGKLEVGYEADFIVLNEDITTVEPKSLVYDVHILETYTDGIKR